MLEIGVHIYIYRDLGFIFCICFSALEYRMIGGNGGKKGEGLVKEHV